MPDRPPETSKRGQPLVRLVDEDYDGAYDDMPSRFAAAA